MCKISSTSGFVGLVKAESIFVSSSSTSSLSQLSGLLSDSCSRLVEKNEKQCDFLRILNFTGVIRSRGHSTLYPGSFFGKDPGVGWSCDSN